MKCFLIWIWRCVKSILCVLTYSILTTALWGRLCYSPHLQIKKLKLEGVKRIYSLPHRGWQSVSECEPISIWLESKVLLHFAAKSLQSCLILLRPHRRQPTRLSCLWDFPGKNTGVGCHFLLQCMKVKSEVAQSCLTLRDPMDHSPPGSFVHGIFQARGLQWVAVTLCYSEEMSGCGLTWSQLVDCAGPFLVLGSFGFFIWERAWEAACHLSSPLFWCFTFRVVSFFLR